MKQDWTTSEPDTTAPLGHAWGFIIERVKAGIRRARFEGRRIGRRPLDIDRAAVLNDRRSGMSLTKVAEAYGISRSMVAKIVAQARKVA